MLGATIAPRCLGRATRWIPFLRASQASAVTNELHALKQDVAAIKQLLQLLVQLQTPSQLQTATASSPALLRQLQAAQGAIERGGSLAAPLGTAAGKVGAGDRQPPKLTNRERNVLELVRPTVQTHGARAAYAPGPGGAAQHSHPAPASRHARAVGSRWGRASSIGRSRTSWASPRAT